MPGNSRGALVEEALPQNLFATRTPLDPLSCHARRARGTAALPVRLLAAERRRRGTTAREGAGIGIHVPVKNPGGNQRLDPDTKTRNGLLRGLRSQGERGFALLTQRWTALQRITASPEEPPR
jgi:hypothetical protein